MHQMSITSLKWATAIQVTEQSASSTRRVLLRNSANGFPAFKSKTMSKTIYFAKDSIGGLQILSARTKKQTKRLPCPKKCLANQSSEISLEVEKKRKLWWKAIKLPIFTVSLVPLMVGASAAYFETGVFAWRMFTAFAAAGMMVIAWLNLSNDAYDSETEVDLTKEESVVNLLGGRADGVLLIAKLFLVSGVTLLAAAVAVSGEWRSGAMLVAAICIGHIYQAPPFRLSYKGLGEPLCFVAFGPLATTAFYLAQRAAVLPSGFSNYAPSPAVMSACVLVGITTSLILFCSHFHQVSGDTLAGKRSPVVRLGLPRAAKVLQLPIIAMAGLHLVFAGLQVLPWTCVAACALTVPLAMDLEEFVRQNHLVAEKVAPAKIYATQWHAAHGLTLSLGLVLARMFL